jgi:hypothetical protein
VSAPISEHDREIIVGLTPQQAALLADTSQGIDQAFHLIAFVGGVGCGKTRGLSMKAKQLADENPGCFGVVVMPTIDMLVRVFIKDMLALLDEWGFVADVDYTYEKRAMCMTFFYDDGSKSEIYFRPSLDPRRLVGGSAAWFIIDEAEDNPEDTFVELAKRTRAPRARLRQAVVAGTPESLGGWFYRECEGQRRPHTHLIRASTKDNHFLPRGYADGLARHLDEQSRKLYLDGHFVARSGRVYTHFDRDIHITPLDATKLDGDYVMGCDFGRGVMAWVFGVVVDEVLYIVGEIAKEQMDTLTCARDARRWWVDFFAAQGVNFDEYRAAQQVTAYIDPAGQAGSISDARILQDQGFNVRYHVKHPRIRDRVNSVQEKLSKRELFIDDERAPYVTRCIGGQTFDKFGLPEKGRPRDGLRGLDHAVDALGYLIEFRWPASAGGGPTITEYN